MNYLLYISDYPLNTKSGHGNMIRMHHNILKSIFAGHMHECYANCDDKVMEENIYCFQKNNRLAKFFAVCCGNPPYLSSKSEKKILKIIKEKKIRYVFVENSVSGRLLKKIKAINKDIFIVAYFPDIERDLMGTQSKTARLYRRISLNIMIRNERITVDNTDREIVLNSRDAELFKKYYHREPTDIIPIIVPISTRVNEKKHMENTELHILFVGVDYYPNVYGLEWFFEKVIPLIDGDFLIEIVGYHMENYKQKWENMYSNIRVVGTVDSTDEYYLNSDVVIAPVFEGGGMKVKTAEALSYGKIVIGTEESTFGYWDSAGELKNNKIFQCNNAMDFAKVINCLIKESFSIRSTEIIEWIRAEYSIESNKRRFNVLFEESRKNEEFNDWNK